MTTGASTRGVTLLGARKQGGRPTRASGVRTREEGGPSSTFAGEQEGGEQLGEHAAAPLVRFALHGASADCLDLEGWSPRSVTLCFARRGVPLMARIETHAAGTGNPEEAVVALAPGSRITYGGCTLHVVTEREDGYERSMVGVSATGEAELADFVHLAFLPRGGQLQVRWGDSGCCAFLPGQRAELMARLLKPPLPFAAGELLEDEVLLECLWPNQTRTRVDLNILIYRLRKDLERAGIDAKSFIVRSPGGGGTQLALAPGVHIEVE